MKRAGCVSDSWQGGEASGGRRLIFDRMDALVNRGPENSYAFPDKRDVTGCCYGVICVIPVIFVMNIMIFSRQYEYQAPVFAI
jgi:hypothetical protein